MYLCYVDESGYCGSHVDDTQPLQVMAGVYVNLYNFHRTDSEFRRIFEIIHERVPLVEIKARDIYRGKGSWSGIDPKDRDRVIEYYLDWVRSRNHKVILLTVDNSKFFARLQSDSQNPYLSTLRNPWMLSAFHMSLVVQKLGKSQPRNKGKAFLVFDEEHEHSDDLENLISDPPDFVDEYVPFNPKRAEERLDQIVDTAYFVKSHHSSMAQVADVIAYIFCRYLQLTAYSQPEAYWGEITKIANWIDILKSTVVSDSTVYPRRGKGLVRILSQLRANNGGFIGSYDGR